MKGKEDYETHFRKLAEDYEKLLREIEPVLNKVKARLEGVFKLAGLSPEADVEQLEAEIRRLQASEEHLKEVLADPVIVQKIAEAKVWQKHQYEFNDIAVYSIEGARNLYFSDSGIYRRPDGELYENFWLRKVTEEEEKLLAIFKSEKSSPQE